MFRDKASELLESIMAERIEKIASKKVFPHPDVVLMMAEKYKRLLLGNFYCSCQCLIFQQYVPERVIYR